MGGAREALPAEEYDRWVPVRLRSKRPRRLNSPTSASSAAWPSWLAIRSGELGWRATRVSEATNVAQGRAAAGVGRSACVVWADARCRRL